MITSIGSKPIICGNSYSVGKVLFGIGDNERLAGCVRKKTPYGQSVTECDVLDLRGGDTGRKVMFIGHDPTIDLYIGEKGTLMPKDKGYSGKPGKPTKPKFGCFV